MQELAGGLAASQRCGTVQAQNLEAAAPPSSAADKQSASRSQRGDVALLSWRIDSAANSSAYCRAESVPGGPVLLLDVLACVSTSNNNGTTLTAAPGVEQQTSMFVLKGATQTHWL